MAGKFTVAVDDKGQLAKPFNEGGALDFISKNNIATKVAEYSMSSQTVVANGTITLEAGKYYIVKSATSINIINVPINGAEIYIEVVSGNEIVSSVSDTLVATMSEACTVIIESIDV